MRTVLGLLLVAALAGCLSGEETPDGSDRPAVAGATAEGVPIFFALDGRTTHVPLDELPAWSLQLCDHGYRVAAQATLPVFAPDATDRSCDFRVTHPLVDPDAFDWVNQHGPANEVSLAVNPTDPLNLAGGGKDYTVSYISDTAGCGQYTVWNGHYWSLDAGRTWTNDLIPGFPGDPRDSPLSGNECNTDPVSVFDSDGTYWHNGLNYRGARDDVGDPNNPLGNDGLVTGSQIFFARSNDKGATFDRITTASFGDNDPLIFNDKNWLAVDPDSDHMIHTWTNFYGGAAGVIEYVESFDGGATWTLPVPMPPGATVPGVTGGIAGVEIPAALVQFSMPQYDADGNVWVIWSGINGPVITFADRSIPALPSIFVPPQTTVAYPDGLGGTGCLASTDFRASVYPVLGVDASGGPHTDRKYIAFPAAGNDGAGIWVTHSDDAVNWAAPMEVTESLRDDQFMSWIDVGPDGTVHVAYYDCSPGDGLMTMGYTHSLDGGATWSDPVHVGQIPFDGDLGHHQTGAPFIGDYIAVDATETGVHFFWADTRHGRSDVYAATIIHDASAMELYAPELA